MEYEKLEQINEDGVFVPQIDIDYPAEPDKRILSVVPECEVILDENYPYLDKSFKFNFMMNLQYLGIFVLVFILNPLKYGLKIKGKKNLKPYKKILKKQGAITVSNHVYRWDFLGVLQAVKYRKMYFPTLHDNVVGSDRFMVRYAGGIPLPESFSAMKKFNEALDEVVAKGHWLHVFPESCRWDYYQPIRPFKRGAFTFAQKYNRPVIPMAYSYREPKGLEKFFTGGKPCFTLNIGTPIFPDTTLSRKECVSKLRSECHKAMVELAGIKQNCWQAEGD